MGPFGPTARSAAEGEDGYTPRDALVYRGGDDGSATVYSLYVVSACSTRSARPSRRGGSPWSLPAFPVVVGSLPMSRYECGHLHPGGSDEADRSAGQRGSLLSCPAMGVIPSRREDRNAQEGEEQEHEEDSMHSVISAANKVGECMRSRDDPARDWSGANRQGERGGSGRCGSVVLGNLCSNAHGPATREGRWIARGGRRGGLALAHRLCDRADTVEANHATVGRGGWRGGRCGLCSSVRLCGNAYLALMKVVANGGASWSRRSRFRCSFRLWANVDAGGRSTAWSGRTKGLEREEDAWRGTGGEKDNRRGTGNVMQHQPNCHQRTQEGTFVTSSPCCNLTGTSGTGLHHTDGLHSHADLSAPSHVTCAPTSYGNGCFAADWRWTRPRGLEEAELAGEEVEEVRRLLGKSLRKCRGQIVEGFSFPSFLGITNDWQAQSEPTEFNTTLKDKRATRRDASRFRATGHGAAPRRQPWWSGQTRQHGRRSAVTIWMYGIWVAVAALAWSMTPRGVKGEAHGHCAAKATTMTGRRTKRRGATKGGSRRNPSRPLWRGTCRWATEGNMVGRRRVKRVKLTAGVRILRLGDPEWWRSEWHPWQRGGHDDDQSTWLHLLQRPGWQTETGEHRLGVGEGPGRFRSRCQTQQQACSSARCNGASDRRRADFGRRRLIGYGTCMRTVVLVMLAALVGMRVGEATHPGYGLQDPLLMRLKEVPLAASENRLSYACPDQVGFRGGKSPGFHKDDRPRDAQRRQESQLKVESANVTGPAGLRTRLRATSADVLLAQETWTTEDNVAEMREWARRQRWTSLWAPARPGSNGGRPSGGAAIFVRSHLGLREPDAGGSVWYQHRACAGIVEVPGYRPTVCVSAYFQDGEGWGKENVALMASVCAGLEAQGTVSGRIRPTIIGADANMTPEDFVRSGVGDELGLQVVRPSTTRGTFRTRNSSRCIDYYVMGGGMADVVEDITTVEMAGISGHTPVQVTFQPRATAKKCLTARMPPRLPTERVVGPIPAPPDYKEAIRKAEEAKEAASCPELGWDRQRRLDEAYAALANLMELELCDITGTCLPVLGRRAENPHLVWRSVLHERPVEQQVSKAARPKWAKGIVHELLAVDRRRELKEQRNARRSTGRRAKGAGEGTANGTRDQEDLARERDIDRAICEDLHDDAHPCDAPFTTKLAELARTLPGGTLGNRNGDCNAEQRLAWRADADAFVATLQKEARRAEDEDRQDGITKWREWLRKDIDQGGRNAHAYSRVPPQWRPATTRPDDWREEEYDEEEVEPGRQRLQVSSAPWNILDDKRNALEQEWNGASEDFAYDWSQWDAEVARSPGVSTDHWRKLPNIEGEGIKRAALAFKANTSSTFDGFHVKHFGMVCEEARTAAAKILDAVEACGRWPSQIALAITPMIPKAKGGYRVIGSMPALYRVWAKTRREAAIEWERKHQRGYYAASPGVGPIDVVWAQAAKQEASAAKGEVAGMILEDLASFYEGISRDLLANEAAHLGFPLQLLRGSIGMYSNPRLVSLNGRVARQIHPRRGVVAGCAFATTYVKVLMTRALDRAVANMPDGVVLDAYIDDLALSAVGTSAQVVDKLSKAHQVLREAVELELGCSFAPGKTAVVATCAGTARRLKEVVGAQGRIFEAAPNLGVDAPAAKPRSAWSKSSLRKSRLVQATQREMRLKKLGAVVGSRATRIYRAGAEKAASYGAEIWGLTDAEIRKLRRLAAATVKPRGRGRSLTLALLLAGAPTAAAEFLAVTQYHRVIWKGVTQREQSRLRGTSLGVVGAWFQEAQQYADELVATAGYADGQGEAGTRPGGRGAAAAWRKVRGPIAAAHLSLARIGWRFIDAFNVQDERGHSIPLTQTAPSLLQDLLVDGVRRQMERKVGEAWGRKDPAFKGRRVCIDVALRNMRGSRCGLNCRQIGAYRSATCGALMTRSRAAAEGYLVQDVCPLCGARGDTVHHRVYHCPKTRAAVEAVVPSWFLKEARGQSADSRFWTTAILPHPGDVAPPPADGFEAEWEYLGPLRDQKEKEGIEGYVSAHPFGGNVYPDGSCSADIIRELRRAGCGAVEVDGDGQPLRKFTMPIPRCFRQTPQAAEHIGYAVTVRALGRQATISPDCLSVVRAAHQPIGLALAASKRYAGITLDSRSNPTQLGLIKAVKWVKAHRPLTGKESPEERMDILGNKAADEAAKEGRERHEPLPKELEQDVAFHIKRAPYIIRAVGTALDLFPPVEQRMARPPRPRCAQEAKERRVHWWRHREGTWRCTICSTWVASHRLPRQSRRETCKGPPMDHRLREFAGNGHRLCRSEGQVPIVFCSRCGAWSSRRPRKLKQRCTAITPPGRQALARLAKGLSPWVKRNGDGVQPQRSHVRHTAAYDDGAGNWQDCSSRGAKRRRGDGGPSGAVEAHPAAEGGGEHGGANSTGGGSEVEREQSHVLEAQRPGGSGEVEEQAPRRRRRRIGEADDCPMVDACLGGVRAAEFGNETERGADGGESERPGAKRKPTADAAELMGATDEALATAIRDSMAARCPGREDPYGQGRWGVFNAVTGRFLVAAIDDLEAERSRIAMAKRARTAPLQRPRHVQSGGALCADELADSEPRGDHREGFMDVGFKDGGGEAGSERDDEGHVDPAMDGKAEARPCCSTVGAELEERVGTVERGRALARGAHSTLATARAGPGGPPDPCSTAVTTPAQEFVAAVAGKGVAGYFKIDDHARDAVEAERGIPACGPPSGRAAPLEGSEAAATGRPQGCASTPSPQQKPPAAGGVGPRQRRDSASPQAKPSEDLVAGARHIGRELIDRTRRWPTIRSTERRRVGCGETRTTEAVARGSDAATARGARERLLRSLSCRSSNAPHQECQDGLHINRTGAVPEMRGREYDDAVDNGEADSDQGNGRRGRGRNQPRSRESTVDGGTDEDVGRRGGKLRAALQGSHGRGAPHSGGGSHRPVQARGAASRDRQLPHDIDARDQDVELGDDQLPRPLPLPLHGAPRIWPPCGDREGKEGPSGSAGAQRAAPDATSVGGDGTGMALDSIIGGATVPSVGHGGHQDGSATAEDRTRAIPSSAPSSKQRSSTTASGGDLARGGGTAPVAEGRMTRQMKTEKCTSPIPSATPLHGIRGRDSAPGPVGKGGGQQAAASAGEVPAAARMVGRATSGRTLAPGAAHEGQGIGTWGIGADGGSSAIASATRASSGGQEAPAKRRRGNSEDAPRDQQYCSPVATSLDGNASTGPYWSSRASLLASLRTRGRPPERPVS